MRNLPNMARKISKISLRKHVQIKIKRFKKVKKPKQKLNKKSLTCLIKCNALNSNIIKSYLEKSKDRVRNPKETSILKLFKSVRN